jgi:hypothetical protein
MSPASFPPNSRYSGLATLTLTTPGGKTIAYLSRRVVPQPDRFALVRGYMVVQGDRLDNLAARFLGDPELFWRLCDANGVLRPEELEAPGRWLRITLPDGIPGTPAGA